MNLLLDTCTFLWIAPDAPELSKTARDAFRSPDNTVHVSAASAWEITLKHGLGRLTLPEAPLTYLPTLRERHEIETLPITEEDALQLRRLPTLHRDPFNRILVCQAVTRGMALLTPDPPIAQYPVCVLWQGSNPAPTRKSGAPVCLSSPRGGGGGDPGAAEGGYAAGS